MSKSLGNFWTIRDILTKVDAMVLRFALINAHYRSPIDMNEALLNDAERNYNRLLGCYVDALKGRSDASPVALPQPDLSSPLPLGKSLGLLEKMGEGFARAMDDDFNSREAVAKVLGMVREISKVLNSDLEAADRNAFSHYAVDLLEETAGRLWACCPRKRWRLRNRRRTLAKLRSPKRWKPFSFNELRLGRPRIGRGQMPSATN